MLQFALNHMTVPHHALEPLMALATEIGCDGVELRNDLAGAMFDGLSPQTARQCAANHGVRIHALAEIKAFNTLSDSSLDDARHLMDAAVACEAPAVVLIPQVGGTVLDGGLDRALEVLHPALAERGLTGLIEPIGFAASTLRKKGDVVAALDRLDMSDRFKLIHDTFHHFLADEPIFAAHTGLVHISGVADPDVPPADMTDAHRSLVDAQDRLGNISQIVALHKAGYRGSFSFEAFAPEIHSLSDPKTALLRSKTFIENVCLAEAA